MNNLDKPCVEIKLEDGTNLPLEIDISAQQLGQLPVNLQAALASSELDGATVLEAERRTASVAVQAACGLVKATIGSLADRLHPDIVAALIKQNVWTTELALGWIEQIPDSHRCIESALAVAPFTPDHLAARLFRVLSQARPHNSAFPVDDPKETKPDSKFWLAPEYYVSSALGLAFRRESAPDIQQINAIARLTRFLPPALQTRAIHEVLRVILDPSFYRNRNEPLFDILPLLPETQIWEIAQTAEQLPGWRLPTYDNPRAELLVAALPRLAELGHGTEALRLIRALPIEWWEGATGLTRIARYLPRDQQVPVLLEARELAGNITWVWMRANVMIAIACELAWAGHPTFAEQTANLAGDGELRTWALARLLPHLPLERSPAILAKIVSVADQRPMTATVGVEVKRCLAIAMAHQGESARALDYAVEVCRDYEWWKLREALTPMAAQLIDLGLGEGLLARLLELPSRLRREAALATLALLLPPPHDRIALQAARATESEIADWLERATALAKLGAYLAPEDQPWLVTTVLTTAKPAAERDWEEAGLWGGVLASIISLLINLPEDLQNQVIDETLVSISSYQDEFVDWPLMVALMQNTTGAVRQRMLREVAAFVETKHSATRSDAIQGIAVCLTVSERAALAAQEPAWALETQPLPPAAAVEPPLQLAGDELAVALREACSINSGLGYRAEVLLRLIPAWLTAPLAEQYSLWRQALRPLTTQRTRADVLSDLGILAPVIASLGGTPAVRAVCESIVAICVVVPARSTNSSD